MSSTNATRLRAIMQFFGLSISSIAKATGMSQTYVSRVLSENDILVGSSSFWLSIEKGLGRLIETERQNQIFDLPSSVDTDKVERLLKVG